MKKKNLSLRFGIRLGVEIVVLITVLAIASVFAVQNGMEKTFVTSTTELIQAHIQGLSYRNSKFMQQLRMYTMADPVQQGASIQEYIDWLLAHRGIRSSDFSNIIFCDFETGAWLQRHGRCHTGLKHRILSVHENERKIAVYQQSNRYEQ